MPYIAPRSLLLRSGAFSNCNLLAARVADAIDHESDCAAAAGQPLAKGAVEALQADLAHGDVERLSDLWRGLPGLTQELVAFERDRRVLLG